MRSNNFKPKVKAAERYYLIDLLAVAGFQRKNVVTQYEVRIITFQYGGRHFRTGGRPDPRAQIGSLLGPKALIIDEITILV